MWSCSAEVPLAAGFARRWAPHKHKSFRDIVHDVAGPLSRVRITLSFSPNNACIPSRGGMVPLSATRGEQA
jgi:hypothetical protein